ncbi:murein biosynthesis integral membrane protein MurJ [Sphingomonas sp. MAH-20]|uniref:Probable lipid II flippase MurJ n=1 Tax=Sphingomonas horti TaxID=2682842 RepID=A0A6I4J538_9SPHN|nr:MULTISPECIES: murein biosynthesis integral membrane protein MurJ [Sphingomonas]MBA2919380.1 murein biosynthesis integral membrane protein MurJ [Sphingomonas sp. CGMCC 1.13658]MVO78261.1 murein biosynthesis integral membrane protein MurJ [Sphingomonas horti]
MSLVKSLGSVGGLTLVSRVLALVRDTLQASYVGAGFASDAFFVAFRLPNMFRALFAEGAFSAAFIPMFNRKVGESGELSAGLRFAERALAVLFPVLAVFTVLMLVAAWPVTWGLSGGFKNPTDEQFAFAVMLSRITIPYLMLISLASLLGGILNSLDRFWVNAAAPILLNIAMIAALWFFHGDNAYETARAQAISVTVGGVMQLGWLMWACRQAGVNLKLKMPRLDDDVRQLMKLILPAAAGAGAVQINLAISTALAGGLLDAGSISYIYYADRLNQLPLGLIGIGLGTILLPTISRLLSTGKDGEAMDTQNRGIELALFLTLPATVAFIFAAEPIVRGLFEHGAFTAEDTIKCGWALSAFSIGLPSYVLVKVLTPGFYARADTKTPVKFATISVGVNLIGNLILIPTLGQFGFGHIGPPLATALASCLNTWMLYHELRKRGHFKADARLKRRIPRLVVAALIMGAALWVLAPIAWPYLTGSIVRRGIALIVLTGGGAAVYGAACFLTGAFRVSDLRALLTRRAATQK